MASHKYDFEVDLENRNNCHTLMVEMVGSNKRVLEVGCATGYMSRVLTDRGCEVTGLELDPAAAEAARAHCARVLVGNVEEYDLAGEFDKQSLDVVVFGDVLEHLADPLATLRAVRPLLRRDGYVVASMPNIAHGDVRLSLLKGRFDYGPVGLLDDTHLRFFTKQGIDRLFRDAGFVTARTERTTIPLFGTEIDISSDEVDSKIVEEVLDDPEATTYQFVVKALLDNGDRAVDELHAQLEEQRIRYHELRRVHEGAAEALDEARVMLEELPQRRAEVEGLRKLVDDLQSSLERAHAERLRLDAEVRSLVARWEALEGRGSVRLYRRFQRLIGRGPEGHR